MSNVFHVKRQTYSKKLWIQHIQISPPPSSSSASDHDPANQHDRCIVKLLKHEPTKFYRRPVNNPGSGKHHVQTYTRSLVVDSAARTDDPMWTCAIDDDTASGIGSVEEVTLCTCGDQTTSPCPINTTPECSDDDPIHCVAITIGAKRAKKRPRGMKKK